MEPSITAVPWVQAQKAGAAAAAAEGGEEDDEEEASGANFDYLLTMVLKTLTEEKVRCRSATL